MGGKSHRVDDLVVVEDNIVLSLGDTAVIPSRVSFEDGKINVEWGEITHPTNRSSIQPEFVTLNKSCVVMSYYGVGNRITAVAGCMDDVETMHMRWGEIVEYSEDYIFHDIIGLTGTRFIVTHARVPWWYASNGEVDVLERQRNPDKYAKKPEDSRLRYGLGIVHPDLSVEIPEIKIINKNIKIIIIIKISIMSIIINIRRNINSNKISSRTNSNKTNSSKTNRSNNNKANDSSEQQNTETTEQIWNAESTDEGLTYKFGNVIITLI